MSKMTATQWRLAAIAAATTILASPSAFAAPAGLRAELLPESLYPTVEAPGEWTLMHTITHIGATSYVLAAFLLGEPVPAAAGAGDGHYEGPDLKTKAEAVAYLKASDAYTRRALATVTNANMFDVIDSPELAPFHKGKTTRISLATFIVEHLCSHHDKLGLPLRLNKIAEKLPPDPAL